MKSRIIQLMILILVLSSCASRKDVIYFQNNKGALDSALSVKYTQIKPYDQLSIMVSASDPEVLKAFSINMQQVGISKPFVYTVDENGYITFPFVGKILLKNKTRLEAIEYIRVQLSKYIKDPNINLTIDNFQVTVLGAAGGTKVLRLENNDRPTILEAIASVGDLSMTAKRNDILVIREEDGQRKSYRLDIRDSEIVNSPGYYLAQNDVIYIEPNRTGIQANKNTWYITLGMTVITLGLTVYSIFK